MKKQNEYIPKPVDTDDITLPKEVEQLLESIARNVHEVWAQARRAEGWTYGTKLSDARKKHPCMVPYDELPEQEKQYDRDTATVTLKFIMKMGFKITK